MTYQKRTNCFDFEDEYSNDTAEHFLGSTLKNYPGKNLGLSSKVYFVTGAGPNNFGLSSSTYLNR